MEGIGMDDQRANAADWRAGKPHDRAWNIFHGLSCRLLIILFFYRKSSRLFFPLNKSLNCLPYENHSIQIYLCFSFSFYPVRKKKK
jgi:hypothetical protein